jgi:putative transposase
MPRANRFFLPGTVWHITHRCHNREFLLKFEKDRQRWKFWLFQAQKRYALSILNYIATSNHVHILLRDTGTDSISRGMQFVSGRTAQEYNTKKSRKGAFWEDRYFATAIATDEHLTRCLVYIDLNMVRAGAVGHPRDWRACGYNEIQSPPERYRIIDRIALLQLFGCENFTEFSTKHCDLVSRALNTNGLSRESYWTESVAVGPESFVMNIKTKLGVRGYHRREERVGPGTHTLKDANA